MNHITGKIVFRQAVTRLVPLILLMLILLPGRAEAQNEGKQLFEKNCMVCHKLGGGKLVGPELVGVTEKREHDWLIKFIRNSQEMVEAGDPIAVQVFEENNKVPMQPFPNLTDADIENIIDYIKNWTPEAKPEFTVDINKREGFTAEEIQAGEKLFHGKMAFENGGTQTCVSCHYTQNINNLDWNPSIYDLAKAFMEKDGMNMYVSLTEPTSNVMKTAHKEYKLTEKEMFNIAAYLSDYAKSGQEVKPIKKFPTRLTLFIVFAVLMTLALIDLIFTKKVRFRAIHGIILVVGIAVHFNIAMVEAQNLSRTQNYAPDQPIKFSHKVHAGDNKTDCRYCHNIADYSKSAGIPSNDVCLACHEVVKEGRNSGKFEINKIFRAKNSGKPVEWIRIHNLQEHVFFSHAQHVNAGKVECETCHGPVEEMDIMRQFADLSMGWCVQCHRDTDVNFTDNKYYSTYQKLHEELKAGKINSVNVELIGGLDCMKCHY